MKLNHERIEALRLYQFIAWIATLGPPMLDAETKLKILYLCALYMSEHGEGE